MILSRRKAHFYVMLALASILPLIFLAGLIGRPSTPAVGEPADQLFAAANFLSPGDQVNVIETETLSVNGIKVLAETSQSAEGKLFLDLLPSQALKFSDVLVYWTAGTAPAKTVGDQAILLGQLSGTSRRHFEIPSTVQGQAGQLLFYSRGQNIAIASLNFTP